MSAGQNYKGARRAFQTCISVIPDFSKAWVSWAQVNPPTQKKMEDVALDKHFETSPNGHSAVDNPVHEYESLLRCRKFFWHLPRVEGSICEVALHESA